MKQLYIIKIGGNVIDNSENLHRFLKDFSDLEGDKILVHGGGKIATDMAHTIGLEPRLVNGRRVTDIETLRVVTMVYAGLINKNIVAQLQRMECNAIGLTGADANLIKATRRPVAEIDFGFVGDLNEESIDSVKLELILKTALTPVFSAITHDGDGQLLNTNADTIASSLAIAMSSKYKVSLVYCFEKKGVLADVSDDESVIREISSSQFDKLKHDNTIAGGMLPKLQTAFEAINSGVSEVYIGHANELTLLRDKMYGTRLFE